MTLRIAIIDDHPLMRQGIEYTLRREKNFHVVATGGSADEAVAIARDYKPDVILLDISLPGCGLAAAKAITAADPAIRILVLTVSERHEDVSAALKAGARGYILKGIGGGDLVKTICSVAAGETYITPQFAARLLTKPAEVADPAADSIGQLSLREQQILKEVSLGLTNKEIAKKLNLSEKTVKHYMSGVLQKLSARNRVEAVVASRRLMAGQTSK